MTPAAWLILLLCCVPWLLAGVLLIMAARVRGEN